MHIPGSGPDGRPRCRWCLGDAEYLADHDEEWRYPEADDRRLFERLSLASFQSGHSRRTTLAKPAL
jgi:DNA-3-methyladenine glycosylase I